MAVPAATPVTTPVVGLTVAIAVLLLLQLPPVVGLVYVVVVPAHIDDAPEIAVVPVDMVIVLNVLHPPAV